MKRALANAQSDVNVKLFQLPDEIESIKIIKPKAGMHRGMVLNLSKDPVLATREFYAKLREVAEAKPDCIIFYKESYHTGERWESLFDRLNKAASLIVD